MMDFLSQFNNTAFTPHSLLIHTTFYHINTDEIFAKICLLIFISIKKERIDTIMFNTLIFQILSYLSFLLFDSN